MNHQAPGKGRAQKRSVARWSGFGFVTVLALIGLFLLFLSSPPGEALIRTRLERLLTEALGLPVRIGVLRTNLFSGIVMENVRIGAPAVSDLAGSEQDRKTVEPGLSIGSLSARYYLPPLLRRRVQIDSLVLRDVVYALATPAADPALAVATVSGEQPPREAGAPDSQFPIPFPASLPVSVQVSALFVETARLVHDGPDLVVDRLRIGSVRLAADSGSLQEVDVRLGDAQVTGNVGYRKEGSRYPLQGTFHLHGNPMQVLVAFQLGADAGLATKGAMDLNAEVSGDITDVRAAFHGRLPVVEVGGLSFPDGELQGGWHRGLLAVDSLVVPFAGGTIRAAGTLETYADLVGQVKVQAEGVSLDPLWQTLLKEPSPFAGRVDGSLLVSGPLADPASGSGTADFATRDVRYRGSPLDNLSLHATYRQGLTDACLTQNTTEISVQTDLRSTDLRGSFSARLDAIEPFAALFRISGLTGGLRAQGKLGGSFSAPVVEADVSGKAIRYQGFPVDTLEGGLHYGDASISFTGLTVSGSLPSIDPERPPFGLAGVGGGFTYRALLDGPLDDLHASLTVDLAKPAYGDLRFDSGRLEAVAEGTTIRVSSLVLSTGSLELAASGSFEAGSLFRGPYRASTDIRLRGARGEGHLAASVTLPGDGELSLQATGEGLPLAEISGLFPGAPQVTGRLSFAAEVHGSFPYPQGEVTVAVADPQFAGVAMDSLKGRVRLDDGEIAVEELELRGPEASLLASGSLGLTRVASGWGVSPGSSFRGQARATDVDLRLLLPLLPAGVQAEGSLTSQLAWGGTLGSPELSGTVTVTHGQATLGVDTPPIRDLELNAALGKRTATLHGLSATVQGIPVRLHGTVGSADLVRFDVALEATLSGRAAFDVSGTISAESLSLESRIRDLDLGLAFVLAPDLRSLKGKLTGTLKVQGTPADPRIDGRIAAQGLSFAIPGVSLPLTEGTAAVSFANRQVTIESLTAKMGGGTVAVSGRLGYRQLELDWADVRLSALDLRLAQPQVYRLAVQKADLRYYGEKQQYVLDGDIYPGDSRLLKSFQPADVLAFFQAAERPSPELPLFLEKTRLDVRLRNADQLWLENNLGRARVQAAVNLLGTPTHPNVSGRVTVQEGYLLFLDRTFTIDRGIADFQSPTSLNPIVDLLARTEVKTNRNLQPTTYRVQLTVQGPLDLLEIGLDSSPSLDYASIVSLLALGSIRSDSSGTVASGNRSTAELLLDRAGEIASGQITRFVGKQVEQLLGLDEFTVQGNLFNIGGPDRPELVATKMITDKLQLSYSTDIGTFEEHKLSMEYKLNNYFSLEGNVNQKGEGKIRLKLGIRGK